MKFQRLIIILLAAVGLSTVASAQIRIIPRQQLDAVTNPRQSADSASLSFVQKHIVAEPMSENASPISFNYKFTNVGSDTLYIRRLMTTCSCVTAVAPVSEVIPGGSADIIVRYNPKGHPGNFERRIFVYTIDDNVPAAVLRLIVNVYTGDSFSDQWPIQMGSIRLKTSSVTLRPGQMSRERIRFINVDDQPVKLVFDESFLPPCLSVHSEPAVVEPGKEGLIHITFNPDKSIVRDQMRIIIKSLGLPPSQSSITINLSETE